ncbi:hypothetical protein [Nocardioides massiliensis]|uniref:Uncharacterized protein n=1 Tax=Nocardioides massiliensis TaxID=1325935 RepID=A0ABT9NJ88_9ACTN|nr:hypothetical protein [Nocardioides massiliensis]MDP9820489.1 hypothetical protein [Nocardioides massiliensis]
MPTFTPPTRGQSSSDHFWGRFQVQAGESVVKTDGVFTLTPVPWIGDLKGLTEGVEWFQGGRTYVVSDEVAQQLGADGFTVVPDLGYGEAPYGHQGYGL